MFNKLLVGNEKAVVGGLSAGVVALLGQVGINSQLTLKEAVYAAVTWLITHVVVYATTNTPKVQPTVVTPTVMNGVNEVAAETPPPPAPAV